ncbi:hypothetical protein JCM5353_002375 [Sporobolomyces roseus]
MADKMDEKITFTTSDDPPASFTISRSALVAHSKVFADMLSLDLKSEDGDKSIPLTETEAELKPFLLMVEGREEELKEALSGLDEKGWLEIATLGDKYDSWGMRNLVVMKAWESHSISKLPLLAFALATISANTQLIKATAKGALLDPKLDTYNGITPAWRSRLHAWRATQIEKVFNLLRSSAKQVPQHPAYSFCVNPREKCSTNTEVWQALTVPALSDFDLSKNPLLPVGKHLLCAKVCDDYKRTLMPWLNKFETETSEWIEFPV